VRRDERLDPLPERVWDLVQRVYAETFFDRRLQLTVIEDAETSRRLYHAVRRGSHQVVNDSGLFFGLALKHLEKDSLLTKEEILQSKVGRPKMLYKPAAKLLDTVQTKSD
jgi:hypothetical protein